MIKVFLSSPVRDLAEYREKACAAINKLDNFSCIRMEDFGAVDAPSLEVCLRELTKSDIMVGIVGHLYGSCPPENDMSFTEHEFNEASDADIPRLMFVAPEGFPVSANLRESRKAHNNQKEFRKRVLQNRTVARFNTPDDLATEIIAALHNHFELGPTINVPDDYYAVVINGRNSLEVCKEHIGPDKPWRLQPNPGERHVMRVVLIPLSSSEPIVLDFTKGELPAEVEFIRPSQGTYFPQSGGPMEIADLDEPRFEEIEPGVTALLIEPGGAQLLLNSTNPRSQRVWLSEGAYTLWVVGTGSASIPGITLEIATAERPLVFHVTEQQDVLVEVEGDLEKFQLENGTAPTSFILSTEVMVTRAADGATQIY